MDVRVQLFFLCCNVSDDESLLLDDLARLAFFFMKKNDGTARMYGNTDREISVIIGRLVQL